MLTPVNFFFLNTKAYKRIYQYYRNPNEIKNSDISQLNYEEILQNSISVMTYNINKKVSIFGCEILKWLHP